MQVDMPTPECTAQKPRALLHFLCRCVGTTVEEMTVRFRDPWTSFLALYGALPVVVVLLIVEWGVGTGWKLSLALPAIGIACMNMMSVYLSGSKPREELVHDKLFNLITLVAVLTLIGVDFSAVLRRPEHSPFKSRTAFTMFTTANVRLLQLPTPMT